MIEIIIGVLIVVGFVKVMWDIEATEKIVEVLTNKVLGLEHNKLIEKMVVIPRVENGDEDGDVIFVKKGTKLKKRNLIKKWVDDELIVTPPKVKKVTKKSLK